MSILEWNRSTVYLLWHGSVHWYHMGCWVLNQEGCYKAMSTMTSWGIWREAWSVRGSHLSRMVDRAKLQSCQKTEVGVGPRRRGHQAGWPQKQIIEMAVARCSCSTGQFYPRNRDCLQPSLCYGVEHITHVWEGYPWFRSFCSWASKVQVFNFYWANEERRTIFACLLNLSCLLSNPLFIATILILTYYLYF